MSDDWVYKGKLLAHLIFLEGFQESELVICRFGKIIKGQKKDVVKLYSVFLSLLLWFGSPVPFYKVIWHLLTLIFKILVLY